MTQEMITIPKQVYDRLLEEVGILNNPEMMKAIEDSIQAEKNGIESWEIDY